ncbi:hypothetical protein K437DRAFT_225796 [Tilletiaria anomala UBC 951]|uniref:25S rRNA adenine-N(1) methyltransferase n=1 Tax=Tilletiaria anomala (strain ATCC 24038 / CBS 436.72 / UBC 951) TaxID=1037660 RepID=A0A066VXB2_TILAU|nr:uncharacterized protein K437DRAFT_225796 [Tilletiaria anomala UBC 951]KDN43190.1 hypothetical protein K437DRAFT_225796 [Tilletiaria anomala UBC 951]
MGSKKSATAHSVAIAGFHTLLKRIAQCQDPREKERLRQQMDETYGGLDGYQKESLKGRDRHNAGETGKWLVQQVGPIWKAEQEASGKRRIRLLDVGSLSGTAYHKYKWIDPVNIDLSPQSERVIKSDFFDWPLPQNEAACFDCVALSLVINFEGNLFRRGNMLLHAHKHLTKAGFLFLVLPLACVENSRYLDHARLRAILHACGWNVVEQNDSAKLTRWLCQRRQDQAQAGWDGTSFKKEEIRKGPSFNNFCIRVGQQGREEKT